MNRVSFFKLFGGILVLGWDLTRELSRRDLTWARWFTLISNSLISHISVPTSGYAFANLNRYG